MMLRISILFPFLLCTFSAFAQQWDFATWHRLEAKGKLSKKVSASIQQQIRLENNSSFIDETFTELALGYDLPKGFDIEGAYRLTWNQNDGGFFATQHRYNIDLNYGRKVWKLKTAVRARYQHTPSESLFNERLEPDDSPMFFRLKVSIAYRKLKKFTPGVAFETFVRLEDPIEAGANRFRYRAFLEVDLPKRAEFEIFYMLQTDYSGREPEYQSVVGLKFAYNWKRPKKKKKKKGQRDK